MSLRFRFRLVVAGASLCMLALAIAWVANERGRLLAERKGKIKDLVESADSILAQAYIEEQQGRLSREQAQKIALETLKRMRYDQDNYFWVHNMNLVMVMHPFRPDLEGTDLTNFRDPRGKALFVEMVEVVKKNGSGFVAYEWPRPGQTKAVNKIAFVKQFVPWGWILGSGIYVDDIENDWRHDALVAGLATMICVALLLVGSETALRSIFLRLNEMVGRFKDIAERGVAGVRPVGLRHPSDSAARTPDEIDLVVVGFNDMLGEIQQRDRALAHHRENLEHEVDARTADLRKAVVQLAAAQADMKVFLGSIPSILIGLDPEGKITRWNASAADTFALSATRVIGQRLDECGVKWLHHGMKTEVDKWLNSELVLHPDQLAYEHDGKVHFLGLTVRRIRAEGAHAGFIVTGTDITEKKSLEEQLRQAQKLEAVGQLAAGVAHEINTPTQFVTDNTQFLKESWVTVLKLVDYCRKMWLDASENGSVSVGLLREYEELLRKADVEYLEKEIPSAIDQSLEGLQRVARIVHAMKEFAHPGSIEKCPVDLNQTIETSVAVARSEWRYVADVETHLEPALPLVTCVAGEIGQVMLNLVVNAAHAIADARLDQGPAKGTITITTRHQDDFVEISVHDTGPGIPDEIQSRIFEPFFTTKPVGKGTGQGLTLAHNVVVKRHQGKLWLKSEPGEGTTFFVQLPLQAEMVAD